LANSAIPFAEVDEVGYAIAFFSRSLQVNGQRLLDLRREPFLFGRLCQKHQTLFDLK
jgi:hypothetical protein